MAKQTFTSGNVLTAAQMTSLQQTAMGGGSATAKTTSYVLVAADAGTTVIMNAAGATTITVNTALFSAGDTVNIQNIGAGVCTITAGTATVNTAGSLAMVQYEGGVLYFVSASVATYFDYFQPGGTTPVTTKGDLFGYDTAAARIPIGTNNQVLTADSAQALGLKWATPASGGMTLLASGTLSGAAVTLSSISGSYLNLVLYMRNFYKTVTAGDVRFLISPTTTIAGTYQSSRYGTSLNTSIASGGGVLLGYNVGTTNTNNSAVLTFFDYATTTSKKFTAQVYNYYNGVTDEAAFIQGINTNAAAMTSITMEPTGNAFGGGTYALYGVN